MQYDKTAVEDVKPPTATDRVDHQLKWVQNKSEDSPICCREWLVLPRPRLYCPPHQRYETKEEQEVWEPESIGQNHPVRQGQQSIQYRSAYYSGYNRRLNEYVRE